MDIRPLEELQPEEAKALVHRNREAFRAVLLQVQEIVAQVRAEGDQALRRFTWAFDGVDLSSFEVTPEETRLAYAAVGEDLLQALKEALAHIERYHALQRPEERFVSLAPGLEAGWVVRPIERVGCYAPGGRAVYPSSVLMTGVPAGLAGCPMRILCVPPGPDGSVPAPTLVAADLAGFRRVFKVGGAQAIAAMAYGTETIPKVDKLFGAGNLWVTAAKVWVSQDVAVDLPAGPSEVLILADETAPPRWVAADLLAQAEHGPDSSCLLVTTSSALARAVAQEVQVLSQGIPTGTQALATLERNGALLVARDLDAAVEFANRFAPEHLQIMVRDPESLLPKVAHAGSIFLGAHSPVAAGDYATGPNHVLPTAGAARSFAGLSLWAFVRIVPVQRLTSQGLAALEEAILRLAQAEGLPAHAQAVQVRLEEGR
ncbi:MAG: histidinol dehydrogenase [Anaerolineae bacterium]